jgi:hypothetical protein
MVKGGGTGSFFGYNYFSVNRFKRFKCSNDEYLAGGGSVRYISTDSRIDQAVFFQNPRSVKELMELKNFDPNGQVVSTRTGIKYPFIYLVYTRVINPYRYQLIDQLLRQGIHLTQLYDSQLSVLSYLVGVALAEKDRQFFKLFLNHDTQIPALREDLMQRQVMLPEGETSQPLNDFINEILTLYQPKAAVIASKPTHSKAVYSFSLANLLQWLRMGQPQDDKQSATALLKKTT